MILVIGAAGFLGQEISRYFYSLGFEVIGIGVSPSPGLEIFNQFYHITHFEELDKILQTLRPQYLINVAGNAHVGHSLMEPKKDFEQSVQLCSSILNSIHKYSIETRVLLASSAAVYGQPLELPIHEDVPANPISPYGYHKWMCELLAKQYAEIFKVKVATMRIFSAYGSGLKKQILWDLCCKCQKDEEIVLSGIGDETRDFIHKQDISNSVLCIFKNGTFAGEVYNVASGRAISIKSLANLVISEFGINTKKLFFTGKTRNGDPKHWTADIRRIQSLGFNYSIDFSYGVKEYIKWFKSIQ